MMGYTRLVALLLAQGVAAGQALSGTHTAQECREGADFIANAAHSRNNGQPREQFLDRLNGDLIAIRSMPLPLRWFARDLADEAMLVRHAEQVYDQPRAPKQHAEAFIAECRLQLREGGKDDYL